MKAVNSLGGTAHGSVLSPISVALAIVIFILDTVTSLEIAVAVFYIFIVLMSISFARKRGVIFISIGCVALTIISYFLSFRGTAQTGLVNMAISISAIGITTYLSLKIGYARIAIHDAREQIAHIGRVTALGELTASIAHEVNQPVAAIVTSGNACLRWLSGETPNLNKARQAVERMVSDANRASEVVVRIRDLAKKRPPEETWLDINDVIAESIALVQSELQTSGIVLHTQLTPTLPRIRGVRVQLQQVLLNLLMNAIEALNAVERSQRELVIGSVRDESEGVLVSVSNTGTAIEQDKLEKIFEAFFTTKQGGMGIGLAITRSIVEAHGGRVWASESPQGDTLFQFVLPASKGSIR